MLFLIRETLIVHWGRGVGERVTIFGSGEENKNGKIKAADTKEEQQLQVVTCRDFLRCEYCEEENKRLRKEFFKRHGYLPKEVTAEAETEGNGHANGHANGSTNGKKKTK